MEPKPAIKPEPRATVQQALTGFSAKDGEPPPLDHVDFYGVAMPPNEGECHFIHGDPKLKNHVYCRHPALKLGPDTFAAYCPYHATVAYRDPRNYRDLSETLGLE